MLYVSNNYVWSDNDIQYFMVNDKCRISGTSWVINLLQLCKIFSRLDRELAVNGLGYSEKYMNSPVIMKKPTSESSATRNSGHSM